MQRQFHHEFFEGEYPTYSPEVQIAILHDIEEYVKSKFGKDSDLEKTIRFVTLVILYKQSNTLLSNKITDKFDDDLFNTWMKEPHEYHNWYDYTGKHHYSSPWNNIL